MHFKRRINTLRNIIWQISAILLLTYCSAQKPIGKYGVLKGTIGIFEGNCMPGPGVPPCKPRPISTTLFITNTAEVFSWDIVVDSVISNEDGRYQIKLAEGAYSLFLRDGDQIVCTGLECPSDCFCSPITIELEKEVFKDLNLDHATW